MNEILYRGKSIAENKWIYGHYVRMQGESFPRIYTGWNCWTLTPEWLFVEIGTVGQYTGLEDKNGEKVFKGI